MIRADNDHDFIYELIDYIFYSYNTDREFAVNFTTRLLNNFSAKFLHWYLGWDKSLWQEIAKAVEKVYSEDYAKEIIEEINALYTEGKYV